MNFDLGSGFAPTIILSDILREVSDNDDLSKKSTKLDFHVHALEEEMNKIEAFKRELPNCMHLLKDAIERLKEERGREVMGELAFIRNYGEGDGRVKASNDSTQKKNWMSSVQLYTPPASRNQESVSHLKARLLDEFGCSRLKRQGAFLPFEKPKPSGVLKEKQRIAVGDSLSLEGDHEFNQHHHHKKQRRCWSPELHNIFVDALYQLGGAQTATPKQIRELMKVDGLTNDEVKSHLQKYRIHIKRVDQARWPSGREQFGVSVSPQPQGPLHADDAKSDSYGWKSKIQKPL